MMRMMITMSIMEEEEDHYDMMTCAMRVIRKMMRMITRMLNMMQSFSIGGSRSPGGRWANPYTAIC